MLNFRQIAAICLGAAVFGACESVDDYVGETLDSFSSEPRSRLAAKPPAEKDAGSARPAAAATARQTSPRLPLPDGQVAIIKTAQSRLVFELQTMIGGTVTRRKFTSTDGRYAEEDALWRGPGDGPVTAGMLLSESKVGPPISDAEDPAGTVDHWAAFRDRQRTFGDLIGSKNVLGPVRWRRARIGTTTCVTFLQRWRQSPPNGPASTLSGYYCAAPGESLSPGEAETVVQSLGIRRPTG